MIECDASAERVGECLPMVLRKRIVFIIAVLFACVGCDQKTKYLAAEHLRERGPMSLLSDIVRLDYTQNSGGFLGVGSVLPPHWRTFVFTVGCSIAIAAFLCYVLLDSGCSHSQLAGLSLICGGGISNLVDRWAHGYVRDFLNVGLGPIRTGIFNLADVALMAGCLLVLLVQRRRQSPNRDGPC